MQITYIYLFHELPRGQNLCLIIVITDPWVFHFSVMLRMCLASKTFLCFRLPQKKNFLHAGSVSLFLAACTAGISLCHQNSSGACHNVLGKDHQLSQWVCDKGSHTERLMDAIVTNSNFVCLFFPESYWPSLTQSAHLLNMSQIEAERCDETIAALACLSMGGVTRCVRGSTHYIVQKDGQHFERTCNSLSARSALLCLHFRYHMLK